jgi:hypothetical protein
MDLVPSETFEIVNSKLHEFPVVPVRFHIERSEQYPDHWLCSICFEAQEKYVEKDSILPLFYQIMLVAGEALNLLRDSAQVEFLPAYPENKNAAA